MAVRGKPVLMKAYGMADLEHDVPNTPDTIFESGSVAKQFTAMADHAAGAGRQLSLDDQVRKHIPELPDYGVPLTIRHMLTHTSGLRDWGSVAGIAGAPRTTREYTHAHVLDIVSQAEVAQLPARHPVVVQQHRLQPRGDHRRSRVSGMSFAEFSKQRIFQPLGMTQHVLARRSPPHRQGPRDRLLDSRRSVTKSRCRSRTCTAMAAC